MAIAEVYRRQVALLVRTIPYVAQDRRFALKGGTAINLFVRNMPRLSVDIDLTYLPIADRQTSLGEINAGMRRIAESIEKGMRGTRVTCGSLHKENCVTKLIVRADAAQVKIEVTPVLRGCVYEPDVRSVCAEVEERFGFAEIQVVSFADLYAGKIVAALDRQHPRDLFDIRELLAQEGIGDELRTAFLVYLLSHGRPMADVLAPARLDIAQAFARGFDGMTDVPVMLDQLVRAREELIVAVIGGMPMSHRRFLLSIKSGEPDWAVLGVPGARDLPAVRWKLENLATLDERKRSALAGRLGQALGLADSAIA
jgi:predicted nucleotidyltransferase component of viral defense system